MVPDRSTGGSGAKVLNWKVIVELGLRRFRTSRPPKLRQSDIEMCVELYKFAIAVFLHSG